MAVDAVCCILTSVTLMSSGQRREQPPAKGHGLLLVLQSVCLLQPTQANCGASVMSCACSRTLEPHLFIFTVESVRAGQEVLLDYGEVKAALLSLNVHLGLCSSLRQPLLLRSLPCCGQGLGFQ